MRTGLVGQRNTRPQAFRLSIRGCRAHARIRQLLSLLADCPRPVEPQTPCETIATTYTSSHHMRPWARTILRNQTTGLLSRDEIPYVTVLKYAVYHL